MAEKILQTRIMLKYDSYENWAFNDPILKQGEAAITVVTTKQDGTANYVPSCLIKIGDGAHKYSELDFVYAKAADVISACKSEATLTTFINNVITSSGIATDEALSALAGRMSTAESDIDALETLVGSVAVSTQITAEIQKLDKADTTVAGQYVSAVSETNGIITVTREALPDYTDTYAPKAHTHAIADVTGLQDALDSKAAAADVTTLSGKVTTLIGSDADKSVRTIANEELAAQLIPESAKESLDTLAEIATWIQSHPDDASAMNIAITKLQNILAGIGGDGEKATVVAYVTNAIDALKNGDIKSAVERITALESDTHTHANKALLDTYTQTEADLADAVAKKHSHANATVLDGVTAEKVAAWDKVSEKANDADLAAIAKTGNVNDLVQTAGDVIIFNCGSASEVV